MANKVDKVNQSATPNAEALAPEAAAVVERLHALMHRLKRSLQQAAQAQGEGLAPMEVRALAFFARHPGSTASELVAHTGRDKAQVARLVQPLLLRGLLVAAPAEQDKRRVELRLTDSGRRIERRMAAQRLQINSALLAGFSADELQRLASSLDRMLAAGGADPA